MNDFQREQWIMNDEGLYDMWKRSHKGITTYVRQNRKLIDELVTPIISGEKRTHYLKYG